MTDNTFMKSRADGGFTGCGRTAELEDSVWIISSAHLIQWVLLLNSL